MRYTRTSPASIPFAAAGLLGCAGWLALVACNTPAKEPNDSAAAALSSPSSPAAAPASTASVASALPLASSSTGGGALPRGVGVDASAPTTAPASGNACKKDSDCRTFSSYCAESPCACRVLLASSQDPKCLGATKVNCFADPCMKKAASCQSGACVLTAQ